MKPPRITSIQLNIALWASVCLIVIGTVIVSYTATTTRATAIKAAQERAVAEARIQAGIVKAEIEIGLDTARARAQELSAIKQPQNPLIINREQVNAMMRQVLVKNPQYIGVWTLWEPNAFDGQDARYAHTKAYGASGRYFPYWNRGTGDITVEPIVDFDTGDWYQEPKRNKREYVTDAYTYPVMGKDVLMISIVAPIVSQGTFYGVAGEDIPVTFLQELADKVNIYNGAGKLFLIGNNGKLVAATGHPEMIGKALSGFKAMQASEGYLKVLQTGQEMVGLTQGHLEAIVPIHFGQTGKPWAAMVILPSDVIVAPANELMWRLVVIALVMMSAGVAALWLVAGQIARPIRQITEVALQVAAGDLTQEVVLGDRHDELGKLAQGFNFMTQQLRSLYGTLEQRLNELRLAEKAVRASEVRYRRLFESSKDGILILCADSGVILNVNPFMIELLGYPPEDYLGKRLREVIPFRDTDCATFLKESHEGDRRENFPLMTRGGFLIEVEFISCHYSIDGERVTHCNIRDITERKYAQAALKQQLNFLQTLIDTIPSPVFYKDTEGKYLGCNSAFESFFNLAGDVIAGKTASDFFPQELSAKVQDTDFELFREPGIRQYEASIPSADGIVHEMIYSKATFSDVHGKIAGLVGVMTDITERVNLEEQLRQSQKMEVMGQLAGGMAHDFNNILSVIIGFGGLAKKQIKDNDPVRVFIEQILFASMKAANLTRSLLTFSRKQPINPQPVNLNEIVLSMERVIGRVIEEDIRLVVIPYNKSLIISADGGQIDQVLMNLTTNARDAMPDGGVLTIRTDLERIDDLFIKTHGYGVPGNFVVLEVTDTGSGIDKETRNRIFEPYFSTKEVGKGTGLGLAITYGIIQQHKGYIDLDSEPGKGTTFRIYLPAVEAEYAEEEKSDPIYSENGTETILLAEDDAEVRQLYLSILKEFGYHVLVAEDGQDAVNQYEANKGRIHLLLFDIVMPKKSGIEAYKEIKKHQPDIKVLFVSGYDTYLTQRKMQTEEGLEIIMKPVVLSDLARRVRCVLDADV